MNLFRKKTQGPDLRLSLWAKLKLLKVVRSPAMYEKLKSRKLWVTVVTAALVTLGSQMGIDEATTTKLVGIAAAYLLGQGIADAATPTKK
jgi:hypothetical protein